MNHFTLESVADGVWGAIAIPDRGAAANAAIVDLGGEVLVFDTTITPAAARDLRAAAEDLCEAPIRCVVLSHWHADHVYGAPAMPPDATVLSTPETRRLMETRTAERLRQVGAERDRLAASLHARGKHEEADLWRELVGELARVELRFADETFEHRRELRGGERAVELLCYGGGHTASDTVALVADAGVLLAGDLVLVRKHVWLGDGDPAALETTLERVLELGFDAVIGGHGAVGGRADVEAMLAYLRDITTLAAERGIDAEPPARYADWDWPEGWRTNLRFLVDGEVAQIDGLPG